MPRRTITRGTFAALCKWPANYKQMTGSQAAILPRKVPRTNCRAGARRIVMHDYTRHVRRAAALALVCTKTAPPPPSFSLRSKFTHPPLFFYWGGFRCVECTPSRHSNTNDPRLRLTLQKPVNPYLFAALQSYAVYDLLNRPTKRVSFAFSVAPSRPRFRKLSPCALRQACPLRCASLTRLLVRLAPVLIAHPKNTAPKSPVFFGLRNSSRHSNADVHAYIGAPKAKLLSLRYRALF